MTSLAMRPLMALWVAVEAIRAAALVAGSPTYSKISSVKPWAVAASAAAWVEVVNQRAQRGSDMQYTMAITLEEAYSGKEGQDQDPGE